MNGNGGEHARLRDLVLPSGRRLIPGDRVRLNPHVGGDVFDLALAGRSAHVTSIEEDLDGRYHVGVIIDDDPGRYLGMRGQPGHQFFFAPDELELVDDDAPERHAAERVRVLVAGIGNVLKGDDGFGVEVARVLAARQQPPGVRVLEAGIRSFDLAYALMDAPEYAILVDACSRDFEPGTVFLLDPVVVGAPESTDRVPLPDGHGLDVSQVLSLARTLGATPARVLVVGCEPQTFGPDEGHLGLSPEVAAAVPRAITMVETLIAQCVGAVAGETLPARTST